MKKANDSMKMTMDFVMTILGHKNLEWTNTLKVISDSSFLKTIKEFDMESITDQILNKVKDQHKNPEFVPEIIEKRASRAAAALSKWCLALRRYAEALKVVKPLKKKVDDLTEVYEAKMVNVRQKEAELA